MKNVSKWIEHSKVTFSVLQSLSIIPGTVLDNLNVAFDIALVKYDNKDWGFVCSSHMHICESFVV